MTPDDDWTVLESAEAGDTVEIAPGTYQFRVFLENAGTAEAPIVIRAQDPDDRPVWDLVGESPETFVDQWPGSYTGGDRGRGCWQVGSSGAYYEISGIVFQNCRAPASAGIRMINSGPVTLRDCLFQFNTNGLTGASTDLIVEHSELFQNGKTLTSGAATHHIYIFGGRFTLRYSYLHDGHEGQAFHIRARESVIEYNWITRPANYVGDVMTCEQFCGPDPVRQTMLLRGNVIVQGEPDNGSQIIALFRDADPDTAASMELTLLYNTIIGTPRSPGQTHVLVNMRNDSVSTDVTLHNNLIVDFFDVAEPTETDTANWSIAGTHNWVTAGTDAAELTGTISGSDPGFVDRDGSDFRLTDGGDATGAADTGVPGLPDKEYYRDEALAMLWRPRGSANDLGAFERGTDTTPVGPYGEVPDGGGGADAGDAGDAADAGDAGPDAAEDTGDVGDGAWDAGDEGFDVAPDAADSGAVDGGTDSGDVAGDPGGAGDDAQNASSVDPTGEGAVGGDSVRDGRGQTSDTGGCGCGVSGGPEPRRVTFALLLLLALWRRRCV